MRSTIGGYALIRGICMLFERAGGGVHRGDWNGAHVLAGQEGVLHGRG